ncbi:hypothetical protein ALT1000_20030 [Alteromonas macleodii]
MKAHNDVATNFNCNIAILRHYDVGSVEFCDTPKVGTSLI